MYGRPKILIILLRLSMGWMFLYSGITKILDPAWTSKAFLENAQTFSGFFGWLAEPQNLQWVDMANAWGQALIGAGLLLGVFTTISATAGVLLMLLYYLPGLDFPFVEHSILVDEHVIYALALLLLIRLKAGRDYGISSLFRRRTPYS